MGSFTMLYQHGELSCVYFAYKTVFFMSYLQKLDNLSNATQIKE